MHTCSYTLMMLNAAYLLNFHNIIITFDHVQVCRLTTLFHIFLYFTPQKINFQIITISCFICINYHFNLKKADLEVFSKSVDMGITDIVPTPDNYGSFVDLMKKASRQNIPRGCRTSYICGLTDETKELYEDYKMQFENDPFNSEITETGIRLSGEIAEAQHKKWQTLIESTDFTHNSRKAWNHQQTVEGLRTTSTSIQGDSWPGGLQTLAKWQRKLNTSAIKS